MDIFKGIIIFVFLFITLIITGCSNEIDDCVDIDYQWSVAKGKENDTIEMAENYSYLPLVDSAELERQLPDDKGVLWLRQEINIPESLENKNISLLIDSINPNDETYINKSIIGKTGLAPDRDGHFFSEWNTVRKYKIDQNIFEDINYIYIRLYLNGEGAFSGFYNLGTEKSINQLYRTLDFNRGWLNIIVSCIILFISIYNLFIYLNRKKEKEYLYYTLVTITLVIWQANFFITKLPFNLEYILDYLLFQKIIYAALHFQIFLFIKFFHSFIQIEKKKVEWFFFFLYMLPLMFFIFVPDYALFKYFSPYQNILLVGSLCFYIIYRSIRGLIERNGRIKYFLFGFILVIPFLLFDIIFHNILHFTHFIYLSFLGTPAFMLAMVFVLARQYIKARNESERLNKTLEQEVELRTEELQKAKDKLETKNKELEAIAHIDPLTEIFNRRYFLEQMTSELNRSIRYSEPLSFIMMDLDYFKKINDNYGHLAGDEVLKTVAGILKKNTRKSDVIGRFGGEEYCILLPHTTVEEAWVVAEKLRKNIFENIFEIDDAEFHVSASFGISHFCSADEDVSSMVKRADNALYKAKEKGRNCIVLYSDKDFDNKKNLIQ